MTHKRPTTAIAGLVLAITFAIGITTNASTARAAADSVIGYVSKQAYQGARGVRVNGEKRQLIPSRDVYSNETVITGVLQETTLRFLDDTKLQVGDSATIKLDSFIYDPSKKTGTAVLTLVKGGMRFISGKMKNKRGYRIVTPSAIIGVRGTDFKALIPAAGGLIVSVLEGSVEIIPTGVGAGTLVRAGQSGTVGAGSNTVSVSSGDAVGPRRALRNNPY